MSKMQVPSLSSSVPSLSPFSMMSSSSSGPSSSSSSGPSSSSSSGLSFSPSSSPVLSNSSNAPISLDSASKHVMGELAQEHIYFTTQILQAILANPSNPAFTFKLNAQTISDVLALSPVEKSAMILAHAHGLHIDAPQSGEQQLSAGQRFLHFFKSEVPKLIHTGWVKFEAIFINGLPAIEHFVEEMIEKVVPGSTGQDLAQMADTAIDGIGTGMVNSLNTESHSGSSSSSSSSSSASIASSSSSTISPASASASTSSSGSALSTSVAPASSTNPSVDVTTTPATPLTGEALHDATLDHPA